MAERPLSAKHLVYLAKCFPS